MIAISGVLMLRHIMAEMGKKLGQVESFQPVMNVSIFRANNEKTPHNSPMFKTTAEFLLGLVMLKDNSVPKDSFIVQDFVCVILEVLEDVISYISSTQQPTIQPIAYTVQELIETFFTGPDDDPRERIKAYYFKE
jgi:hypothetical protein